MINSYEKYKKVRVHAPRFPQNLEWLGTEKNNIDNLKNRIILLDFWTFCCINCIHVMNDLKYLENKYKNKLQVIGVHSPKFDHEKNSKAIVEAMNRYNITHPVVNDKNRKVWDSYTVSAWPTFILIDPEGYAFTMVSGEGNRDILDKIIGDTIEYYDEKINWPDGYIKVGEDISKGEYSYPSKIDINEDGNIAIAETGKNRIVVLDENFNKSFVIGSGNYGFKDGKFEKAEFKSPQGVKFLKNEIYVADTENHLIRKCNIKDRNVTTIAGNGEKEYNPITKGKALDVSLNSPWDIEIIKDKMYIAMAGNHQIWRLDLSSFVIESYIGTGEENIRDGGYDKCLLAQTSSLCYDGENRLYFIDSETSSLRYADLKENTVRTLIGKGLFYFGNKTGNLYNSTFQHPLGVSYKDKILYVADTYNNRVVKIDLDKKKVSNIQKNLNEPSGLDIYNDTIYVCDTNNGRILNIPIDKKLIGKKKLCTVGSDKC
ncbi:thioredoxin-like domain-containing protein [Clostridium oceanicum]|uniref:Thioredoxin-like domain-containing protein n=1 Tax=Clostridium oceanicum TaxID=1543 RepID=A0ABP3V4V1_9CLOT